MNDDNTTYQAEQSNSEFMVMHMLLNKRIFDGRNCHLVIPMKTKQRRVYWNFQSASSKQA